MDVASIRMDELIDLISYRRDRFGLVADIFSSESSEETVTQMLTKVSDFDNEFEESIELSLYKGLNSLEYDDLAAFTTKTRTEYARLFLGPREVLAPLHESAYLSGTLRMFTAETLAVRKYYEKFGYVVEAKNREPEDSIGVELEFLRNLCNRCASLLQAESAIDNAIDEVERLIEAQRVFKALHLNRWAKEFVQRVIESDQSGFYVVWAIYLSGVLDEDSGLLLDCEGLLAEIKSSVLPEPA